MLPHMYTRISTEKIVLGPSMNDVIHLGGSGDLPEGDITPYHKFFSKINDKEEGEVKNLIKWVTTDVIYGCIPLH